MRSLFAIAAALVTFGCATISAHSAVPTDIANAVANPDRPDDDRQRDADRKPAEVLTAAAGSGLRDTTLHRIDEASVKSEVEAAGFRLDGESDSLRNAGDPRTANVKDPTIRGKTDQFILIFGKPKH